MGGYFEMKRVLVLAGIAMTLLACAFTGANAQKGGAEIDVQHYRIDAELLPASQLLKARAEVRFVPLGETRFVCSCQSASAVEMRTSS